MAARRAAPGSASTAAARAASRDAWVTEQHIAPEQPDLEHGEQEQDHHGEQEGQLHRGLAPLPPAGGAPRHGHDTWDRTRSRTELRSFVILSDLVAHAASSSADGGGPKQHERVLGCGLAVVASQVRSDPVSG